MKKNTIRKLTTAIIVAIIAMMMVNPVFANEVTAICGEAPQEGELTTEISGEAFYGECYSEVEGTGMEEKTIQPVDEDYQFLISSFYELLWKNIPTNPEAFEGEDGYILDDLLRDRALEILETGEGMPTEPVGNMDVYTAQEEWANFFINIAYF